MAIRREWSAVASSFRVDIWARAGTLGVVLAAVCTALPANSVRGGVGIGEVEAAQPQVEEESARLVVSQVDGMYALSVSPSILGPRGVFYTTARPIEDPRLIEIPAAAIPTQEDPNPPSPTQPTALVLWHERRADGNLVACRAIRLGGRAGADGTWNGGDVDADGAFDAGFVQIGEIDYRIMLRYAKFDPVGLPGQEGRPGIGEPAVPAGLRAADVPGGCDLYIVSFWTEVIEEFRESVGAGGATILSYLPDHAYIVRMDEEAAARVSALSCVRWTGSFHPVYRINPARAALLARIPAEEPAAVRYNVQLFDSGPAAHTAVTDRITALGGSMNLVLPGTYMFSATLTLSQLREVVGMNELAFASLWGPAGTDMDQVRIAAGASTLETIGFTGAGVRGEVMDGDIQPLHQDFATAGVQPHGPIAPPPPELERFPREHGTCTFGIVFGNGFGDPLAKGLLPGAAAGGIFAWEYGISPPGSGLRDRWHHTAELVGHPDGMGMNLRAVFQSNSWGTFGEGDGICLATLYDSIPWELDRIVLHMDLLVVQSQGNLGENESRSEAWAKNVVSVAGICHNDTLGAADDAYQIPYCVPCPSPYQPCQWVCSQPPPCSSAPPSPCAEIADFASFGPACDGRIKPDLHFFYHHIRTPTWRQDAQTTAYTCSFGGTSAATPQVAGCAGLLFQMWHQQVFPGLPDGGPGVDVFASRPHCATAKAMLINTGFQYDFTDPDFADITRARQGWGRPNVQTLYESACGMFIVDHTDGLKSVGQYEQYELTPAGGSVPFKVTLVYTDPPASLPASIDRINDLDLQVIAPDGTLYKGNRGLQNSLWSAPGGARDDRNTVENVFIEPPVAPGTWLVRVIATVLVPETTPESLGDYALVASGVAPSCAARIGDWNGDGRRDVADLYAFVQEFLNGSADSDQDGSTTATDFFRFLDAFFSPVD